MKATDIIARLVRLENEKAELAADIAEVMKEAKAHGFDPKAIKLAVKRARETDAQRIERERIESEAELYEAEGKTAARIDREKAQIKASRPADPPHDPETGEVVETNDQGLVDWLMSQPGAVKRREPGGFSISPPLQPDKPIGERITDLDRHPAEADA